MVLVGSLEIELQSRRPQCIIVRYSENANRDSVFVVARVRGYY